MPSSRRRLLRATATAAGAALAGCGSLPSLRTGGGDPPPHDWLYDPTEFGERSSYAGRYLAPATLADHRDRLAPAVREALPATPGPPWFTESPPAERVDWRVQMVSDTFSGPVQAACGGEFGEDAARAAATSLFDEGATATEGEPVAGLSTVSGDEETHGAYREGLAVAVAAADDEQFRRLVATAADGERRLRDADDDVAAFLDRVGFETAANFAVGRGDGLWRGRGTGYRVDGATTRLRHVLLNDPTPGGESATDLGVLAQRVDGLRDVSVEADGPLRWLSATADTDRVGFNGATFALRELPYE
jgi:hypothetical protein